MHTSELPSGNTVNHNGGWDGDLEFENPPTLVDCLDVLALATEYHATGCIEDGTIGAASSWLVHRMKLEELRVDIE